MGDEPKIMEFKTAWVVYTNTDLTEGKGRQHPVHVCEKRSTAVRLGRGEYVMGSNCPIEEHRIFLLKRPFGREWYGPIHLVPPSRDDVAIQKRVDAVDAALNAARELGLSEEHIKALTG